MQKNKKNPKKYAVLKGIIHDKGFNQTQLAKELGISVQTMNAKLNGKTEFYISEAIEIGKILGIDNIGCFFLNPTCIKCK